LCVSPVTLPCVRNSTLGGEAKGSMPQCGLCRQALRRRWVLLADGSWHRLDGSVCFVCLRATSRAKPKLLLAGVHTDPSAIEGVGQPAPPRKLEICSYGPFCYSRNPFHFAQFDHPWLVPSRLCSCGRPAGDDGWCCSGCEKAASDTKSDIELSIAPKCKSDVSGKAGFDLSTYEGTYAYVGEIKGLPLWRSDKASFYRSDDARSSWTIEPGRSGDDRVWSGSNTSCLGYPWPHGDAMNPYSGTGTFLFYSTTLAEPPPNTHFLEFDVTIRRPSSYPHTKDCDARCNIEEHVAAAAGSLAERI
jgi:hypothetical protein